MALSVSIDPAQAFQTIDGWGVDLAYQYAMSQDVLDLYFSRRSSITVGGTTGPGIGLSIAKASSMYATWMLRKNPTASASLAAWEDYLEDGAGNVIQGGPASPNFNDFATASSKSVIEAGATIYATPGQGLYDEPLSNAVYIQNTHGVRILGIVWPRIEHVASGGAWAMNSQLVADAITYADWVVRCIIVGVKAGLNFWAMEPQNEPEGGAGPNFFNGDSTPNLYVDYLVAFRARLNQAIATATAAGDTHLASVLTNMLVVGPAGAQWGSSGNDTGYWTSYGILSRVRAYEAANPYAGGPHVKLLEGMTSHNYGGRPDGVSVPVPGLSMLLPSEGSPISSAAEGGFASVLGYQSDLCSRGNAQDTAIGLHTACMYNDYVSNRGATGYVWFWARSHGLMPTQPGIWGGAYGGLRGGITTTFSGHPAYQITPDPNDPGSDRMRFWVLGNFSRFVRPGWKRIYSNHPGSAWSAPAASNSMANPAADVYVSAFKSPDGARLAIVAVNTYASAQAVTITVNGQVATVTPWVTSPTQNLAVQADVTPSGSSFSYTLPAQSVTTFDVAVPVLLPLAPPPASIPDTVLPAMLGKVPPPAYDASPVVFAPYVAGVILPAYAAALAGGAVPVLLGAMPPPSAQAVDGVTPALTGAAHPPPTVLMLPLAAPGVAGVVSGAAAPGRVAFAPVGHGEVDPPSSLAGLVAGGVRMYPAVWALWSGELAMNVGGRWFRLELWRWNGTAWAPVSDGS